MSPQDRLHVVFDTAYATYFASKADPGADRKVVMQAAEERAHQAVRAWRETVTGSGPE